MHIKYKDTRR